MKKKGKKIKTILFLGLSKAGKTSLIAGLMGHSIKKFKVNGMETI